MNETKRLWIILGSVLFVTFFILGWFGKQVYRKAPPIPGIVQTESGDVLMTREDILKGQQAWQSMGGQQVGSIWGHGAYQAPDWSADWLHREAVNLRDLLSRERYALDFEALMDAGQAEISAAVKTEMRKNTYDEASGILVVSALRARAMARTAAHYTALFGSDPGLDDLRESYALQTSALPDPARREVLNAFFFWTSWAAATPRPGSAVTYTNNWPHEPLVGNHATPESVIWSLVSVAVLLLGIGALVWFKASRDRKETEPAPPAADPLESFHLTPSMKAVAKYAFTVIALFCVQVLLGGLTAHYTVEGNSFYGFPLAELLPYAVSRTWHIQTGIFWIATAFLTAGLFLAPAVGGREPKYQRLGVNVLYIALLLVVAGSLFGEWLSIQQKLSLNAGFWFGDQGYEYIELGRFWQILLWVGLILWLTLMLRGLWPALREKGHRRQLVLLFAGSSAAIGLFYGAGFFYSARTHISIMEFWRWWVVHLWVEGFFEVFATAAIAFIFVKLALVRPESAVRATLFSTAIYLFGGIPGTFHHLYFSGTPISIMAVGASFSALEVVPLALIGFEAWETHRMTATASWMERYRWPIRFFLGVSFWNLVGAGILGFFINPPIALYYMQGLNTTPVHAHAALFGVYGLLALGLVLLVLRRLYPLGEWKETPLRLSFWLMNIGLVLMIALSLLPIGLMQAAASIEVGPWYARSAEYLQQPVMETLRWLRTVGDVVFLVGVGALAWFVVGLKTGWSYEKASVESRRRGIRRPIAKVEHY